MLGDRPREDVVVIGTRHDLADPLQIKPGAAGFVDRLDRDVLVGEESGHDSHGQGIDPLLFQNRGRVMERGLDVVGRQLGVALEDLLVAPALGQ